MLSRIVSRSIVRRRRRKLLSLAAVTLGIAVTTAVATLALDVGDKVGRELRSFGANISVTPAADGLPVQVGGVDYRPVGAGAFLAEADLVNLKKIFWQHNIEAFAPFLYLPAEIQGRSVVLTGTWFDKELPVNKAEVYRTGLKSLHPTWKVEGAWPEDGAGAASLVGRRLAASLGLRPGVTVEATVEAGSDQAASRGKRGQRAVRLTVAGILETGGPEDDQLFAPLAAIQALAGREGQVRRVEVSALTKPEDDFARSDVTKMTPEEFDRWYCSPYVSAIAYQIQQAIPGAEAKPVYRVAETEGRILGRVSMLMAVLAGAALVASALAVGSMMWATVLERRAEIGLFQSLGATGARVATVFLLEALIVGLLGGVAGYFAGSFLARGLALRVFGLATDIHWVIFPVALALALMVTLLGSALPLRNGLRLSPVAVLRNE
jgi:putative ABC transport system permease protein